MGNVQSGNVANFTRNLSEYQLIDGKMTGELILLLKLFEQQPTSMKIPAEIISKIGTSIEALREKFRTQVGMDIVNDYNFVFCGRTGSGKSLINAIRNMSDSDINAAPVGEEETTEVVSGYRHPNYPRVVLWDVPGAETPEFGRENYFLQQNLFAFDCIVVVTSGRFTQLDIEVGKSAVHYGSPVVFVRTKCDCDVRAKVRRGRNVGDAQKKLRSQVEEKCRPILTRANCAASQLFFVSAEGFRDCRVPQMDESRLLDYVVHVANSRIPTQRQAGQHVESVGKSAEIVNELPMDKSVERNIGVTGAKLVGKSTLIKSLLGVKENGVEDGANLGWKTYAHPLIPNLKFHEIPYGHDNNFQLLSSLDVVCLLVGGQFVPKDLQMFGKLKKLNRPILLIRTKADLALKVEKQKSTGMSDELVKVNLRHQLISFLKSIGLKDQLADSQILILSAKELAVGNSLMDEMKLWPSIKQLIETSLI